MRAKNRETGNTEVEKGVEIVRLEMSAYFSVLHSGGYQGLLARLGGF